MTPIWPDQAAVMGHVAASSGSAAVRRRAYETVAAEVEKRSCPDHHPVMQVRALRRYFLPDLADHVIHFTGRTGSRINVDRPIEALSDQERLAHIVVDQRIRAFEVFGANAPVARFTESTKSAVSVLLAEWRYTPCGVGFSKQALFDRGGGPALYVRGDEWHAVQNLPQPLRSRAVRFWPGAEEEPGESLPNRLKSPSEWLHEREWRVPGDFCFDWHDIAFIIAPDPAWQGFYAAWIAGWAGDEYRDTFEAIPTVVMDQAGGIVADETGVWT